MDCEVYIKTSAKQLQIIFVFYFYKAKFRKVGYSCFCRCTLIQRVITQPWLGNTSAACIGRRWLSQPSETCQRQKRILSEFQRGIEKTIVEKKQLGWEITRIFSKQKTRFCYHSMVYPSMSVLKIENPLRDEETEKVNELFRNKHCEVARAFVDKGFSSHQVFAPFFCLLVCDGTSAKLCALPIQPSAQYWICAVENISKQTPPRLL